MKEIWKSIKNWEGFYEVSNLGRVRSLDRHVEWGRWNRHTFYEGRILKTDRKLSKGYPIVVLTAGKAKKKTITVHRLVAETFIPNPYGLPFVRHKDDDPANAIASNLRWGTAYDNANDRKCPHCKKFLHRRYKK